MLLHHRFARRWSYAVLVTALASPAAVQCQATPDAQSTGMRVPTLFVLTGTLPKRLEESSGIAVSRAHPGVLWTHNDSGEGPMVYATNLAGEELGRFDVRRAQSRDWEDIGLGPCPPAMQSAGDCLYIGDTGDNSGRRNRLRIFVVPEPEPPDRNRNRERNTDPAGRVDFRVPGGPADIEALAVTADGDVVLVSKGRHGPVRVFQLAAGDVNLAIADGETVNAQMVGTLALSPRASAGRLVTGAAISPAGDAMVVRTYLELYFYRREPTGRLTLAGAPCFLGPVEPQGEAVDYLDAETLVLTSEAGAGRPGTIYRVRCE